MAKPNTPANISVDGVVNNIWKHDVDKATVKWGMSSVTNLIPTANRKFESMKGSGGTTLTKTQNVAVSEWNTTGATRVRSSGGTATLKAEYQVGTAPVGGVRVFAMYIKNNSSTPVEVGYVGRTIVQPNDLRLITGRATSPGDPYVRFITASASTNLDITVWNPILADGDIFFKYELQRKINGGAFTPILTTPIAYTADSLYKVEHKEIAWGTVQYRVRAINSSNEYSSFRTGSVITIEEPPPEQLEPPNDFTISNLNNQNNTWNYDIESAEITWQASTSEDVDYYSLERSINGGDYEVIQDNDNLSHTDYRHEDWETVRYRIKAVSTVPLSSEYIYSPLYTVIPPPIPEPPNEIELLYNNTPIEYIDYDVDKFTLTWDEVTRSSMTYEIERSFNDGIFQNVKTTTGLTHIEEVEDCWTNVQYRIRAISPYNKYSPFTYSKKYTVITLKEEHGILQPFGLRVNYAESRFDVTPTLRERVATAAGVDGEYYFGSDFEPKLFDYVTWTKGVFSEEDKKKLKDKIATVFACFRYGALNLVRENRVHKVSPIAKADIVNYPLHLDINLGFKASPIGHSLVENQEYGKSEYINNGNETTFPTIILKGELVNPSFKVNDKIYHFFTQVEIADGDIVTIDCKTRTVVLTNSQGDIFNYLGAWCGEFPTFNAGANTFDIGDIPAENIIVRWYDTWV